MLLLSDPAIVERSFLLWRDTAFDREPRADEAGVGPSSKTDKSDIDIPTRQIARGLVAYSPQARSREYATHSEVLRSR
jgi:hypothetical protein